MRPDEMVRRLRSAGYDVTPPKNTMNSGGFAARLKQLREQNSWSLQQVADKVDCSKAHVWELEKNRKSNPSSDLLFKLSRLYDVDATELYLGETP